MPRTGTTGEKRSDVSGPEGRPESSPRGWADRGTKLVRRWFSRARLVRVGIGLSATVAAFAVLLAIGEAGVYNVDYAQQIVGTLLVGLQITIEFVAFVVPVGFVIGFFVGWARTSSSWILRGLGSTYVEFFRGMPPLVLVFFSWLIATLVFRRYLGVEDPSGPAFAVGILALALHSAAYQAEIVRAGILSVPSGQLEAGDAIGLSRWQTMARITLPQAFRVSLPALGNEFASLIKDTSLLTIIAAVELSQLGLLLTNDAFLGLKDFNLAFVIWTEVALLYFAVTFAVTRVVRGVENLSKVPGLEAAQL